MAVLASPAPVPVSVRSPTKAGFDVGNEMLRVRVNCRPPLLPVWRQVQPPWFAAAPGRWRGVLDAFAWGCDQLGARCGCIL